MASLLEKFSTLISANLHYMVDQALKSNSLAVIDQYIRQVEDNLEDLEDAAATGVVTLDMAPDLPAASLDATRVRLAIRNLLDNAARHGAGGKPPRVSVQRGDHGLVVRVRDHGPGVAPAQLDHLGEAFYRTDAARQRVTGGVGLGLHLARQVALAHGGSLSFRNADPGLEAILVLPLQA